MITVLLFVAAQGASAADPSVASRVDALLSAAYKPNEPGAVVIVVKDGRTVLRKAYGLANLEAKVPLGPEAPFPIGSVTKQFTAALVLKLAEDGKLRIDDDVGKWFPEHRERLRGVTVEHLLTHTSGIPAYTDLKDWVQLAMQGRIMERPAIVSLVLTQPPRFAAGEAEEYSNSNFLLLASMLEQVSGRPYRDLVVERLAKPLGMSNTRCGGSDAVRPLVGYNPDGRTPALRIGDDAPVGGCSGDGGLITTIDDLARWDAALTSKEALSAAAFQRMFTPSRVKSGVTTTWAYGWEPWSYEGHATFAHGGYIFGFVSYVLRAPADRLYVAFLTNNTRSDMNGQFLAKKVATIALGKPYEPAVVDVPNEILDNYVGLYEKPDKSRRRVVRDSAQFYTERVGGRRNALLAETPTTFCYRNSFTRIAFTTDSNGKATRARTFGEGAEEIWTRVGDIKERKVMRLDPADFSPYVGQYEIGAGRILTISREGDSLFAQPTGGNKEELFPESPSEFFLKAQDVQFRFEKDASGAVTKVVIIQPGGSLDARRRP